MTMATSATSPPMGGAYLVTLTSMCSAVLQCFPGQRNKLAECLIIAIATCALTVAIFTQYLALSLCLPSNIAFVLLSLGLLLVTAVFFRPLRLGDLALDVLKHVAIATHISSSRATPDL